MLEKVEKTLAVGELRKVYSRELLATGDLPFVTKVFHAALFQAMYANMVMAS